MGDSHSSSLPPLPILMYIYMYVYTIIKCTTVPGSDWGVLDELLEFTWCTTTGLHGPVEMNLDTLSY